MSSSSTTDAGGGGSSAVSDSRRSGATETAGAAPPARMRRPSRLTTRAGTCRAASIKDCVDQLSEIWTTAAEQAEANPSDRCPGTTRLGDPRLARHIDEHEKSSVRVRMRTSVLTLVVIAPRPGDGRTRAGGDQRPEPAAPVAGDRRLAGRL